MKRYLKLALLVITGALLAGAVIGCGGNTENVTPTPSAGEETPAAEPTEALPCLNTPLDASDPVEFYGAYIKYNGETISLNEKAIYVDASLSDELAAQYDFVYNDFAKAGAAFQNGTEEDPMKVYIAPYVYWIDDPDDPEIRVAESGDIPYGMVIACSNLHLIGLTKDPYNVVLAVNRGQTQGAKGNYTMFYFNGSGTRTENLTMGNYCNVDLEYALKPELSRARRADAITQAQLALTNGDKIVAVNCNFISRLNACPFAGSSGRILFRDCHIECGDDALPGTAVYLNCTLGLYSSKPFYNTSGTGAVFLNCVFESDVKGTQYLTKAGGTVTIIDSEFISDYDGFTVEWTPAPDTKLRCIQSNVTLNGEPFVIGTADESGNTLYCYTIDLSGTEAANAYAVSDGAGTVYNTYNLLQGSDGWDPLNNKPEIEAIDAKYTLFPYAMTVGTGSRSVNNGNSGSIEPTFRYFRNVSGPAFSDTVTWTADDSIKDYLSVTSNADGSCAFTAVNNGRTPVAGMLYAKSSLGYSGAIHITIQADIAEAPGFATDPSVQIVSGSDSSSTGYVTVDYTLDTEGDDISFINWYRVSADGAERTHVATSRLNEPEYTYQLTAGDVGYCIEAVVAPLQVGTRAGTEVSAVTDRTITFEDYPAVNISTDFQNFPTGVQHRIQPGFWTVEGYKPLDTAEYDWSVSEGSAWTYGEGEGGATGTGLLQSVRGSRILYTPVAKECGDMSVRLVVDPCKSAGQGFGSATAQYMDVYIKMDNETLNGYALRIERTNKYSNAVDFKLIKYTDGVTEAITDPVSASCYNSTCTIELTVSGSAFTAHVETTKAQSDEQAAAGLAHVVDLSAEIEPNTFGGSGVLHTGTAGANATMLHQMDIIWE